MKKWSEYYRIDIEHFILMHRRLDLSFVPDQITPHNILHPRKTSLLFHQAAPPQSCRRRTIDLFSPIPDRWAPHCSSDRNNFPSWISLQGKILQRTCLNRYFSAYPSKPCYWQISKKEFLPRERIYRQKTTFHICMRIMTLFLSPYHSYTVFPRRFPSWKHKYCSIYFFGKWWSTREFYCWRCCSW